MRGFISFIIDAIVPASCIACGRGLHPFDEIAGADPGTGDERSSPLHPDGLSFDLAAGVRASARVLCPDCWRSLEPAPPGALDGGRFGGVPLIAPFFTNDPLLALVRFLKFSGGRSAAPPIARQMARSLERHLHGTAADRADVVLLPVPLHPRRLAERGYNQAILLASGVAGYLGLAMEPDALVRTRNTKSQSKLEERSRAANVKGAFGLARPQLIVDKHVILVDDLVTTGETALACLEALASASPYSVAVLAAARAGDSRLTSPY